MIISQHDASVFNKYKDIASPAAVLGSDALGLDALGSDSAGTINKPRFSPKQRVKTKIKYNNITDFNSYTSLAVLYSLLRFALIIHRPIHAR